VPIALFGGGFMNFMGAGPLEIFFVLVVALLVLGPNKMLEASRELGKLMRQFSRVRDEWPKMLEGEAEMLDQPDDSEKEQENDVGEAFRRKKDEG
jgi:Sec-independent protein translocase protein TatA